MGLLDILGFSSPSKCRKCGEDAKQVGELKDKDGKVHPVYTCTNQKCPYGKEKRRWTG